MELAQERLQKNPNDTGAMYALGISYGLRSSYYWVVKKAWRDALKDATAGAAAAQSHFGARSGERRCAAGAGAARLHGRKPAVGVAHARVPGRDPWR